MQLLTVRGFVFSLTGPVRLLGQGVIRYKVYKKGLQSRSAPASYSVPKRRSFPQCGDDVMELRTQLLTVRGFVILSDWACSSAWSRSYSVPKWLSFPECEDLFLSVGIFFSVWG
jgi:hypothetical protein